MLLMKWLKRLLILLAVLLTLTGIAYVILCYWIKSEIEARATEKLGAKVAISSLWLSPFSGEVSLGGVEITFPPGPSGGILQDTSLSVERARVRVALGKLWESQLQVTGLWLEKPNILLSLNAQEFPPSIGDLARIRELLKQRKKPYKTFLLSTPLLDLEVKEGSFTVTLLRPNTEPFSLSLSNVFYEAHALSVISVPSLMEGSRFAFDLASGGHVEKKPGEFMATGLDLSLLGALFGADDALKFSAGTLDIHWQDGKAALTLHDLTLASDIPSASVKLDSALQLSIPVGESLSMRSDPVYLMLELWNGLWGGVVDTLESSAKKKILEKSAKAFRDWYTRQKSF